jgi:hypothetical protein
MTKNGSSSSVFGLVYDIVAIPYNFFVGFVLGLAAPVAAIAAMVFGVRLLTGKMPFLRLSDGEEPERRLLLDLVEQDQAQVMFEGEKEKVMTELRSFLEEIKGLVEDARAADKAEEI